MTPEFDPLKPARTLADSDEWAIYDQQGQCWLYNHSSDTARRIERPRSWLTQLEQLTFAVREANETGGTP